MRLAAGGVLPIACGLADGSNSAAIILPRCRDHRQIAKHLFQRKYFGVLYAVLTGQPARLIV